MFVSESIGINAEGHLTFNNADTVELAHEYGTPVYLLDENSIRERCREYKKAFSDNLNGRALAFYASKALSFKEIYRICADEGMGIDVVSGGEIYTAVKAGFPMERACFHGNNKTRDELELALDCAVGRIAVDNFRELDMLKELAAEKGKTVNIFLRIKPGVDPHTHEFISTGQLDSKYGFAISTGEAMKAVKKALESDGICLKGLHCHIGSQIMEIEPFELAAQVMMDFLALVRQETGEQLEELNLGGGFAVKYLESDCPPAVSEYISRIAEVVKKSADEHKMPMPFIMFEPGRATVGTAGMTLYTVGAIKDIPGVRTYASVDGGMTDNPRYILYQSDYTVVCANKAAQVCDSTATIAGKCCESGDMIQEHIKVPRLESGDILAVLTTGAYNYSMSSNYNRNCRPPIVIIKDGKPRIAVKRETYEDIVRNDI